MQAKRRILERWDIRKRSKGRFSRPMRGAFRIVLPLTMLAGCAQITEISLPPLDNTALRQADALVVAAQVSGHFSAPRNFVKSPAEGAKAGMGEYMNVMGQAQEGALLLIVLAPIVLPMVAAAGSSKAPTVEEAEAAIAVFERYGQDRALLASVDRRVADRLAAAQTAAWTCLAVRTPLSPDPCPGAESTATLTLAPRVALLLDGKFDPDIFIFASVTATANGSGGAAPVEAEWRYRGDLGKLFELAADDGALLRAGLEALLDMFATAIAEDLFLDPRPETIRFEHFIRHNPEDGRELTGKGVVRRAAPTEPDWLPLALFDESLIIADFPPDSEGWRCAIASLDGETLTRTTGGPYWTSGPAAVTAPPGEHRVEVACLATGAKHPFTRSIMVATELGTAYCTDGRTVTQAPGYPNLSLPYDFCRGLPPVNFPNVIYQ